jgi:hypothetical protein
MQNFRSLKTLKIIIALQTMISFMLLFYFMSKPDIELGFFVIAVIFSSTIFYFLVLYGIVNRIIKNQSNIKFLGLLILIALDILPVFIHLALLDFI